MDLTNINGLSDIESQVKAFEEEAKKLNAVDEYAKIEADIRSAKRRIEQYEEMKAEKDNTMDYVESARHEGSIKSLIEEENKKLEEAEKAKAELDKKMSSPEHKKEENELRDKKSAFYTQAAMKIESEIKNLKLDMEIELQRGDSQTKHKNYHDMQDKLNDLQKALSLCKEQKSVVVAEFAEAAKPINDILKETYGEAVKAKPEGEKPEGEKPEGEKPEGEKPEGEKPEGEKPEGEKPGKPLAKIDGYATYLNLGPWNRYKMKRDAYIADKQMQENEKLSFGRKVLLMLPSTKYSDKAIEMLANGEITAPEGTAITKEPEQPKTMDRPEQWGALTPEQQAEFNRKVAEMAEKNKGQGEKPKTQEKPKDEATR